MAYESKQMWSMDELLSLGQLLAERQVTEPEHCLSVLLAARLLRVRDRNGTERPLKANAVQLAYERCRGPQNIVLKARQMGMTTWIAGRMFLKTITQPGTLTVQVAHTREAAEGIFRCVQRFWECLPVENKDAVFGVTRMNVGQMRFSATDSEFRVLSAGEPNAGRGLSIQNLHLSEVSRWTGDADLTMAGLRAALCPGGELVLESTPNGAYGCFFEEWQRSRERGLVRHFFPWWKESSYTGEAVTKDLTAEEMHLLEQHGLSAQQIGFRRQLQRSYRGLRLQEFAEDAESCFLASGSCCFELPAIEARLRALERGDRDGMSEESELQIWLPAVAEREYVLAVDTAGGGADGDFSVCEVVELETGLQCAELQRRMGPMETAERAAKLAREYGCAMIVVERNNHGSAVVAYLHSRERYTHLYETAGAAGWLTTAANKPAMVSGLGVLLAESSHLFSSRRLLTECRSFVTHGNGRTAAAAGTHDDCVMAMAVAQAARAELLRRRRTTGLLRRWDAA